MKEIEQLIHYICRFKYRIYLTKEQKEYIDLNMDACRYVKNYVLGLIKEDDKRFQEDPTHIRMKKRKHDLINLLPAIKAIPEHVWLNKASSAALQHAAQELSVAFSNMFKQGRGYPRFHSWKEAQSMTLSGPIFGFDEGNNLYIPKLSSSIKVIWDRPLPSKPTSMVITKNASGEYYVSFVCRFVPAVVGRFVDGIVGCDFGIANFIKTSDGEVVSNPKNATKLQTRLAKLQARHARTEKGSKNREKLRILIAKIYQRITNMNMDFLHKTANRFVEAYRDIVIENLDNVELKEKKNAIYAKHNRDVQFGKLRILLTYKVIKYYVSGFTRRLLIADRYYPSSQLCSCCRFKNTPPIPINIRRWTCPSCKTTHDRDFNAAQNLVNLAKENKDIWRVYDSPICELKYSQPVYEL